MCLYFGSSVYTSAYRLTNHNVASGNISAYMQLEYHTIYDIYIYIYIYIYIRYISMCVCVRVCVVACVWSVFELLLYRNHNRNLRTSRAPIKSQAHQVTSLFTSAAINQRGFQRVVLGKVRSAFPMVREDYTIFGYTIYIFTGWCYGQVDQPSKLKKKLLLHCIKNNFLHAWTLGPTF